MRPTTNPPRPLTGLATMLDADSGTSRSPHAALTGVTIDSRDVRRGDLYVALPGSRAHGAAFAAEAMAGGAVAVLTDREGRDAAVATGLPVLIVPDPRALLGQISSWVYGQPAHDIQILGVTGTSGKSTTTFMLEAGLRAAGHTTGLVGGVEIHAAGLRFEPTLTTPEASVLHSLFALMREEGVSAAAMEVSSHALALGRIDGVYYDVALFTNLSQDHLDFHKDFEDYFATKVRLFQPRSGRSRRAWPGGSRPRSRRRGHRRRADAPRPRSTPRSRAGPAGAGRAPAW
jgi:UDP-N-acetylmuramoyl-L-alanyl-D-glutamate--2,6-diaminopimelate ligase